MKNEKITLRSKVGWEYSTTPSNDENGNWKIEPPEKPYFIGTIRTVTKMIQDDKNFQAMKSGGTYYNSRWFLRRNNKWLAITDPDAGEKLADLYDGWHKQIMFGVE
jgi:hypothetical protein